MTLIYLRHGDDRGNDVYKHDRSLNDRGKRKAGKLAKRLIDKYGHPDVVFVSPFRRALETLEAMSEYFERNVEVLRDPRIAQRLSEKQQTNPRVSPKTRDQIAIVEDRDAFRKRVRDHIKNVQRRTNSVIWCITHQIIIEEVADHFDMKISRDLDFLDYIVVGD